MLDRPYILVTHDQVEAMASPTKIAVTRDRKISFPLATKTELVADTLESFALSGQVVTARLTEDINSTLGDTMELKFDLDRMHIFDRKSEVKLNYKARSTGANTMLGREK